MSTDPSNPNDLSATSPAASGGVRRPPANRPLLDLTLVVGTVVVLALALSWWLRRGAVSDPQRGLDLRGGLAAGNDAPNIVASGWLNGPAPTAEQLKGKVVVVDAWFTTCHYCKLAAPQLIETYNTYRGRDVVFIGLTYEDADRLPEIKNFLNETGITWPNGYGARQTLIDFDAEYFPAAWVIGRDGKIVWNHDSPGELADGIERALSQDYQADSQ